MRVKVCDAICGAGKTVACINMFNANVEQRYIFITPYLDEVDRIKRQCSGRNFTSPEKTYANNFSKLNDLHDLLKRGVNIASTHALFSYYTDETKELIRVQGYTLVLDEVLNIFQQTEITQSDMNILYRSNTITQEDNEVKWSDDEYQDGFYSDLMFKSKSNNLVKYGEQFYFWSVPPDVFECFSDVYVLTYLFRYQVQKYFFDMYGIEYELIGVKPTGETYNFCPLSEMDRAVDLKNKIHILSSPTLNTIGDYKTSLSVSWYDRSSKTVEKKKLNALKNNLYNVFHNIFKGNTNTKMWTTFNDYHYYLRGKGYSNSHIPFNMRASNEYRNRKYLAYCVNVYLQPWIKNFFHDHGIRDLDEDMYALSMLVQWVFRSAVRAGKEVWIYIPSIRMRTLLKCWIDNLAYGKDLDPIKIDYKAAIKLKNKRTKTSLPFCLPTDYGKSKN